MGQTRSFGDVGSMSGLPESGHGWAIYEDGGRGAEGVEPPSHWAASGGTVVSVAPAWGLRRRRRAPRSRPHHLGAEPGADNIIFSAAAYDSPPLL